RIDLPERRIIRVEPETWRKACYGTARLQRRRVPKGASAKVKREAQEARRAQLKAAAIAFARRAYGVEASDDEAEAICIGGWASEARSEIEKALGVRVMKQIERAA